MSYSFVKITSIYNDYLCDYYERNPGSVHDSYAGQLKQLLNDGFGWADYYSVNLGALGVDAHEIIVNARPLQAAWARERGINATHDQLVIEQLKGLKPDVVFVQDTSLFSGEWVAQMKRLVPSVKAVIGWCCSPFTSEQLMSFRVFDCMLSCTPGFIHDFTKAGLRSYLLNHGFESRMLSRIHENNAFPMVDILFAGSFQQTKGYHGSRTHIIEKLLKSGLHVSLYGKIENSSRTKIAVRQAGYMAASILRAFRVQSYFDRVPGIRKALALSEFPRAGCLSDDIASRMHRPIYGLEMLKAIAHSRIGFNMHIEAAGRYAGNMRLFEVTGAGSCLLTDWKENLKDLFSVDTEVVTYKSSDECIEKATWLFNNAHKAEEIAKSGQRRTMRDHTFAQRASLLHDIIRTDLLV